MTTYSHRFLRVGPFVRWRLVDEDRKDGQGGRGQIASGWALGKDRAWRASSDALPPSMSAEEALRPLGQLHHFTFPRIPGWKPASLNDAWMLGNDLVCYGDAFATEDGRRVDPRTVTIRDGIAYSPPAESDPPNSSQEKS